MFKMLMKLTTDWHSKNYVLRSKAFKCKYPFFAPEYIIGDENDVFMVGYNNVPRARVVVETSRRKKIWTQKSTETKEKHCCIVVLNADNLSITNAYTIYEKDCTIGFVGLNEEYLVAIICESDLDPVQYNFLCQK